MRLDEGQVGGELPNSRQRLSVLLIEERMETAFHLPQFRLQRKFALARRRELLGAFGGEEQDAEFHVDLLNPVPAAGGVFDEAIQYQAIDGGVADRLRLATLQRGSYFLRGFGPEKRAAR